MGVIWTKNPRSQQPQTQTGLSTLGHTSGVLSLAYPNGPGLWDAARQKLTTKTIGTGGLSTGVSFAGRSIVGSNGGGTDVYALAPTPIGNPWLSLARSSGTVFALIRRIGNAAGNAPIFGVLHPSYSPYATLMLYDAGGTGNITLDGSPGGSYSTFVSSVMTNGALEFWVGTYDGSAGRLYKNGVLMATSGAVSGALTVATQFDVAVMNFGQGGLSRTFNGEFYLGGISPLGWSPAFVAEVSKNPWSLVALESRPIFFNVASGANTTATLSSTLDAATLTGVGAVTRSGTLAVTLDVATLTGIGAVTRSGTLSSTLDAATLSGAGTVAVGTNRDGTLASTLADVTLVGIGAVTRSGTLAVTLDAATLAGIGDAGQAVTGTLAVTLDNATLRGIGAIPAAPSTGGGKTTGSNLSRKQKKKLKAVESQEWLKAEETARQLLSDRFTKQTPQEKAQALETYIESLQPVIEALKALTSQIEEVTEVVEEDPVIELTQHQEVIQRFDRLEKKVKSVEELIIILMADL